MTPRQAAKLETTRRIKELALAQLATSGAGELSLRAIARELNLVSSAMYRYFASRDELLTDLIVDAYDDVAATLQQAAEQRAAGRSATARAVWLATALALREWAVAQPHRFALVYGSPIPGYAAPERTIEPAGRVIAALLTPAAGMAANPPRGSDRPQPPGQPHRLPKQLQRQAHTAAGLLQVEATPARMILLAGTFARLIGALSLELGGHFVGTFDPADQLYAALAEREADTLGLSEEESRREHA